jgi:hypothetical protein
MLLAELPVSNGFIFQVAFTLVVAGVFIWQAIRAWQEVKR